MEASRTEKRSVELTLREAILPAKVGDWRAKLSAKAKQEKRYRFYSQFRLWQRNFPALPVRSAALAETKFKNSLCPFTESKIRSSMDAQRLLKSFLARNERVTSPNA
jgi:hypothetical protein